MLVTQKGLCGCFRLDQHFVGGVSVGDGDAEQWAEDGASGFAAIEVRAWSEGGVGLQVFAAQAVVDAGRPAFEVGEEAIRPGGTGCAAMVATTCGWWRRACRKRRTPR
jgi:hypothetical protein